MFKYSMTINKREDILYNNILLLSRNKLFFTKFNLNDTFQNRIYLIFIHISFLFIKIKQINQKEIYKNFYQKMFDLIFKKIELNMREIGYGDIVINKNMKFLVIAFYNILLNCENFNRKSLILKKKFFSKYAIPCVFSTSFCWHAVIKSKIITNKYIFFFICHIIQ